MNKKETLLKFSSVSFFCITYFTPIFPSKIKSTAITKQDNPLGDESVPAKTTQVPIRAKSSMVYFSGLFFSKYSLNNLKSPKYKQKLTT